MGNFVHQPRAFSEGKQRRGRHGRFEGLIWRVTVVSLQCGLRPVQQISGDFCFRHILTFQKPRPHSEDLEEIMSKKNQSQTKIGGRGKIIYGKDVNIVGRTASLELIKRVQRIVFTKWVMAMLLKLFHSREKWKRNKNEN